MLRNECDYGIYNIVNSGAITAKEVVGLFKKVNFTDKSFKFFEDVEDFYLSTGSVPRSNCVLSNQKLIGAGIKISNVHDSIERCIKGFNEMGS